MGISCWCFPTFVLTLHHLQSPRFYFIVSDDQELMPPNLNPEIAKLKAQLHESLSKKYIDLPLLLGLTAVVQSKFHLWITDDFESYYERCKLPGNGQPEGINLQLAILFEAAWAQFFHPVIKFFQRQHAEMYQALIDAIKKKEGGKVVEMRKLNESFLKCVTQMKAFYSGLQEELLAKHPNSLLPSALYLRPENDSNISSPDFESNHCFLLYHCYLGLGNLARHSSQIYTSFVLPCKSSAALYKHLKDPKANLRLYSKYYAPALQYYFLCISLLPALNEPYNHVGVIFNAVGHRFNAVMWFLRSQFTRLPNYMIGRVNMQLMLLKPWLHEDYKSVLTKALTAATADDANTCFLRIMASFFVPSKHAFYLPTAENKLQDILNRKLAAGAGQVFSEHLPMLLCFYCMCGDLQMVAKNDFEQFFSRYINLHLKLMAVNEEEQKEILLKNLRLLLGFFRVRPNLLPQNKTVSGAVIDAINHLMDENGQKYTETYQGEIAPVRSYYFGEDVHYKDFMPIGFQFRDFNDDHLFTSGNVDLLFGPSSYLKDNDIPSFLDNDAVSRIQKTVELKQLDDAAKKKLVKTECQVYENDMRLLGVAFTLKKIFGDQLSADEGRFSLPSIQVAQTQKPAIAQTQGKKKTKSKNKSKTKKKTVIPISDLDTSVDVPATSLEDIELIIAGHISNFGTQESKPEEKVEIDTSKEVDDTRVESLENSVISEDILRATDSPVIESDTLAIGSNASHMFPSDSQPQVFSRPVSNAGQPEIFGNSSQTPPFFHGDPGSQAPISILQNHSQPSQGLYHENPVPMMASTQYMQTQHYQPMMMQPMILAPMMEPMVQPPMLQQHLPLQNQQSQTQQQHPSHAMQSPYPMYGPFSQQVVLTQNWSYNPAQAQYPQYQ